MWFTEQTRANQRLRIIKSVLKSPFKEQTVSSVRPEDAKPMQELVTQSDKAFQWQQAQTAEVQHNPKIVAGIDRLISSLQSPFTIALQSNGKGRIEKKNPMIRPILGKMSTSIVIIILLMCLINLNLDLEIPHQERKFKFIILIIMGCCSSKQQAHKGRTIQENGETQGGNTPMQSQNSLPQIRLLQGNNNSLPVVGGGAITPGGTFDSIGKIGARGSADYNNRPVGSQISSNKHPIGIEGGSGGKTGTIQHGEDFQGVGPLIQQNESPQKKKKTPVFFDLTPSSSSPNRPNQIYHAINGTLPPVTKPYSTMGEWQAVLQKHQTLSEEEMVAKLLSLKNRNWILEQLKYANEQNQSSSQSLDSILISRKILSLKEHFNWLVWSLAQFYFFFNGTSSYYSQFQGGNASTNASEASGANGPIGVGGAKSVLPKVGSKVWSDGFEYKGVYIKVLPYEDAQYIRNELKALKYAQIELLELKANVNQPQPNQMHMTYGSLAQFSGSPLHQQVLLPLIAGVSCGGFYLYATPVIHIPKTPSLDMKIEKDFQHLKSIIRSSAAPQSLIYSPSPQPPENYDLNSSYAASSINPRDENLTADSMFKYMPILKNATSRNLIPIFDYESYPSNQAVKEKGSNGDPPLFYIMLNLYDILPRVNLDSNPLVTTMRIPANASEEVSYHRIAKGPEGNYIIEAKDLRRFILTGQLGNPSSSSLNTNHRPANKIRASHDIAMSHNKNMDLDESDVDLQADEYQNFLGNELDYEDREWLAKRDDEKILEMYQKRSFSKHGWDFILVSKKQQVQMGTTHGPFNIQQLVNQNENKRATNIYSSRESQLKTTHPMHEVSFKQPDSIPENPTPINPLKQAPFEITPSKVHVMPLEEYNALADQTLDYSMHQQHNHPNQFIHTNRLGLFFRQEGRGGNGGAHLIDGGGLFENGGDPQGVNNKVYGTALISAKESKKDFKLCLSICNHSYSTNLEQMFAASVDQVALTLEQSDKYQNTASLKDLMHRKGLNMRFSWLVLSKLRQIPQRELVMVDILLRVMRKIVNEEVKVKSIAKSKVTGEASIEEYYQGGGSGSVDSYKEMITFYINTLLKRKILKYKQVFEETLLGLFLQRMSVLNMVHNMGLKGEEYFYIESKDILEDIIDVPAKNPSLFLNSVSSYFKLDFKPDFLRTLRQDRYVFIAKCQLSKSDIKPLSCRTSLHSPFSIKEEAYFILAHYISKSNTQSRKMGQTQKGQGASGAVQQQVKQKIKTKTDKDRMGAAGGNLKSARESSRIMGPLGSLIHSNNTSVVIESQEIVQQSETFQNLVAKASGVIQQEHPQIAQMNQEQSQTNRNKEPILHDFRQPKDSLSTIRQYQNMEAIINESPQFAQNFKPGEDTIKMAAGQLSQILDFSSKFSKRNNFKPTQPSEIILPPCLYKLKTFFSSNEHHPLYCFDDATKTIAGGSEASMVLQPYYELPSVDVVEKWTIVLESLVKDVYTVNGSEQVLLEAFVYQALLIYFYKNGGESDELFKVLAKIRETLFTCTFCSPETLILIQMLTGMYFEEKRDQSAIEAEKSYLTAMVCIFQLYGDPRGRGNYTIPYSLFLSWKLSLIALAEDKKLHDSEFAEELFDASLGCLYNHKRLYREQQIAQNGINNNSNTANSSLPTEMAQNPPLIEKSRFEIEVEKQERKRYIFDMRKYKGAKNHLTFASGIHKSIARMFVKKSQQQQAAMNVYVSVNHHYNNNKELKGSAFKNNNYDNSSTDMFLMSQELFKSRSQVPMQQKRRNNQNVGTVIEVMTHGDEGGAPGATNQNIEHLLDPSEIDLDIEDENKNFYIEENFGGGLNESTIGICPFQHWSVYRQHIMQILQQRNLNRGPQQQQQLHSTQQRELYRDMVLKFLHKDLFFQWLARFNPMMYQSGQQWSNLTIREFIFCQNQQMVNSSSSSVVMSNHHSMSQRSQSGLSLGGASSVPTSAKEKKNVHLGSYSQILGKEVGGISKQDMHGVLYTMGTDAYGQLGMDAVTSQARETHSISLKVLYPRMIVSLRDELIKEICCGHSHTFAINVHGQVFAWGLNEGGQLGLGPEAPPNVRKPILNPYLQNVSKMSAGNEHSLAINKNGELYIWGGGGATGLNDLNTRPIPTKLEFFHQIGAKIHQAVCGGLHTVVVTKEGEVYSWGSTEGGQLGLPLSTINEITGGKEIPVLTPYKIPAFEGIHISQVACGEVHCIALAKDGRVFGWGLSNYGQLGLGFSSDSFEPGEGMEKSKVQQPVEITHIKGGGRIGKIYCGGTFSLFQTEKGDLYGCGMNDLGQLGLDTYMEELLQSGNNSYGLEKVKRGRHQQASSDVTVPTKIICFQGIPLHNLACGENHALAVSGDEKNMLWAWGMYKQGQLGLGEVTMKMNPRPVQTLCSSSIQKITCGSMHSLTLIGDTQQISSTYFNGPSTFETLQNHWQSDFKGLSRILSGVDKESEDQYQQYLHQYWSSNQQHNFPIEEGDGNAQGKRAYEVAEQEGEGKVKNPK